MSKPLLVACPKCGKQFRLNLLSFHITKCPGF